MCLEAGERRNGVFLLRPPRGRGAGDSAGHRGEMGAAAAVRVVKGLAVMRVMVTVAAGGGGDEDDGGCGGGESGGWGRAATC